MPERDKQLNKDTELELYSNNRWGNGAEEHHEGVESLSEIKVSDGDDEEC